MSDQWDGRGLPPVVRSRLEGQSPQGDMFAGDLAVCGAYLGLVLSSAFSGPLNAGCSRSHLIGTRKV